MAGRSDEKAFEDEKFRMRCALCNDDDADYPNNADGRESLKEHADDAHNGTCRYQLVRQSDL